MNKLLAELVPSDMKLSADVRDLLADCCTGAPSRLAGAGVYTAHADCSCIASRVRPAGGVAGGRGVRQGQEVHRAAGARGHLPAGAPSLLLPPCHARQPCDECDAAQELGFGAYTGEVTAAVECWKQEDKATSQKRSANKEKGKAQGMSDEEAAAAQQKLFAEARARVFGTQ